MDKVDLSLTANQLPVIVDGIVTDQPGPDTVKLTRAYPVDGTVHTRMPILGALVTIADDAGNTDNLIDIGQGYYITNALNGTVGRTYQLSVELRDTIDGVPLQTIAISTPQRMVNAGTIDTVYYEYTSSTNRDTGQPENGFNIYLNTSLSPGSSRRIQWTFLGTYTTTTDAAAVQIPIPCDAPPCGFTTLACAEGCLCCTCWYEVHEQAPIVSTPIVLGGSQLTHVFMNYVPINQNTFFLKYRVEISQVELSEEVFQFYQAIRKQADNSASIFQPPFFELKGNISVQSGNTQVLGTFAASALVKKYIYIPRSAVPLVLPSDLQVADCRNIAEHPTTTPPPYWQ